MSRGKGNKLALILVVIMVISFVVSSFAGAYASSGVKFSDVKTNNWAYEGISWGVGEGIVNGLPGGKFGPEKVLTEAEFLAMYIRFAGFKVREGKGLRWSDGYYEIADKYNIKGLQGSKDLKKRSRHITRGEVAQIIASSKGFDLNTRQAVYFMYQNKLSKGRVANRLTFESYKASEKLTRAEIPLFLMRIDESCEGNQLKYKDHNSPVRPQDNRTSFSRGKVKVGDRTATDAEFSRLADEILSSNVSKGLVSIDRSRDTEYDAGRSGRVVKANKLKELGEKYFVEDNIVLYNKDNDLYIDVLNSDINKDILSNADSDFELVVSVYGSGGYSNHSILTHGGSSMSEVKSLEIGKGQKLSDGLDPVWGSNGSGYDVTLAIAYKGKTEKGVEYLPSYSSISLKWDSGKKLVVGKELRNGRVKVNNTPFGVCSKIEIDSN